MTNFFAIPVFLLIQGFLLLFCYMSMILRGHSPFFLAYPAIIFAESGCLCLAHVAFFHFIIDPFILAGEAVIYLVPARMGLGKMAILGKRAGRQT